MGSRLDLSNAIRALAMDAVQQANSGHPGMPMGMADIAEVLWRRHLKHNPANPHWPDRDRFVLSNGHGSMLLVRAAAPDRLRPADRRDPPFPPAAFEDARTSRAWASRRAWKPRPARSARACNAVGMALAEKLLAAQFNRDGHTIVDHHTYVFLGDGCLMEGISHEACSLAGTLGLGKLIAFYDDNGISIDSEKGSMRALVYRRYAAPLRGLRLARDRGRRRP